MFWFFKNCTYPIGVDMGDNSVKLAQLATNGKDISLIAGGSENRPQQISPGSASWQRWAIETIKNLLANAQFRGKEVIAAIPASQVFIDHIKMPKTESKSHASDARSNIDNAVLSKIKQRLPFDSADAMVRFIPTSDDIVLAIAAERKIIDRHLAVYEQANLNIKSIGIWPIALTNTYTKFFGRRKTDLDATVMLICMEPSRTNVVICRHKNLLFARSISIGADQLDADQALTRLTLELTACRQHFDSMHRKARIQRLIFLSSGAVDKHLCTTIAKQAELPAQIGDCLAAVQITNPYGVGIDRRNCQVNYTTAFGLSLSGEGAALLPSIAIRELAKWGR
jgi:hypothetical protein